MRDTGTPPLRREPLDDDDVDIDALVSRCNRSREVCVPLDDNESAKVRDMVSLDDDAATTLCRDCVGEAVGDDLSVDGVTNGVRRVVGDAWNDVCSSCGEFEFNSAPVLRASSEMCSDAIEKEAVLVRSSRSEPLAPSDDETQSADWLRCGRGRRSTDDDTVRSGKLCVFLLSL